MTDIDPQGARIRALEIALERAIDAMQVAASEMDPEDSTIAGLIAAGRAAKDALRGGGK